MTSARTTNNAQRAVRDMEMSSWDWFTQTALLPSPGTLMAQPHFSTHNLAPWFARSAAATPALPSQLPGRRATTRDAELVALRVAEYHPVEVVPSVTAALDRTQLDRPGHLAKHIVGVEVEVHPVLP